MKKILFVSLTAFFVIPCCDSNSHNSSSFSYTYSPVIEPFDAIPYYFHDDSYLVKARVNKIYDEKFFVFDKETKRIKRGSALIELTIDFDFIRKSDENIKLLLPVKTDYVLDGFPSNDTLISIFDEMCNLIREMDVSYFFIPNTEKYDGGVDCGLVNERFETLEPPSNNYIISEILFDFSRTDSLFYMKDDVLNETGLKSFFSTFNITMSESIYPVWRTNRFYNGMERVDVERQISEMCSSVLDNKVTYHEE